LASTQEVQTGSAKPIVQESSGLLAASIQGIQEAEGVRPTLKEHSLDFDWEPYEDEEVKLSAHEQELLRRYEMEESATIQGASADCGSAGNGWGEEEYEKSGDLIMEAFQKRLARWPSQVVRYGFQARPLWAAQPDPPLQIPLCGCGQPRCFEMQLLPTLLHQLQVHASAGDGVGMDWNTVLVYTCAANCESNGKGNYHQEYAYVQEVLF